MIPVLVQFSCRFFFCETGASLDCAELTAAEETNEDRLTLDRSWTLLILPSRRRVVLVSYIPLALASARAGGVIALPAPPCTCFVFTSTDYRCAQPQFEPCGPARCDTSHSPTLAAQHAIAQPCPQKASTPQRAKP